MSERFGHEDDVTAMDLEIERVGSLTVAQLGAEAMIKGFGPEGPGGSGKPGTPEAPGLPEVRVGLADIAREFTSAYAGRGVSTAQRTRLDHLIAEGLQALEHASLVRVSWRGGVDDYTATRRGRTAIERGEVQRILDEAPRR